MWSCSTANAASAITPMWSLGLLGVREHLFPCLRNSSSSHHGSTQTLCNSISIHEGKSGHHWTTPFPGPICPSFHLLLIPHPFNHFCLSPDPCCGRHLASIFNRPGLLQWWSGYTQGPYSLAAILTPVRPAWVLAQVWYCPWGVAKVP